MLSLADVPSNIIRLRPGRRWQARRADRVDVLLFSMPFGLAHMPSLGLSLLKAELAGVGVKAEVHYLFLEFAEELGYQLYQKISQGSASSLGDWIFYPSLWGEPAAHATDTFWNSQFPDGSPRDLDQTLSALQLRVEIAQQLAEGFIDAAPDASIGRPTPLSDLLRCFSKTSRRSRSPVASRSARPGTLVVFGGPNCEAEMGVGLMRLSLYRLRILRRG